MWRSLLTYLSTNFISQIWTKLTKFQHQYITSVVENRWHFIPFKLLALKVQKNMIQTIQLKRFFLLFQNESKICSTAFDCNVSWNEFLFCWNTGGWRLWQQRVRLLHFVSFYYVTKGNTMNIIITSRNHHFFQNHSNMLHGLYIRWCYEAM